MTPDWLAKLLEIIKIPIKYVWVLVIATAFIILCPDSWLQKIGLLDFRTSHLQSIGLLLVLCGAIAVVTLAQFLGRKWRQARDKGRRMTELVGALARIDPREVAILREFLIQGQHTIQLPTDHASVAGLLSRKILRVVGNQGERSLAGALFPVAMNPQIRDLVTPGLLGMPDEPSEDDIERVRSERPEFIPEIKHHNEVFHTTWRADKYRF